MTTIYSYIISRFYMYPDQRRASGSSNASSSAMPSNPKDDPHPQSPSQGPPQHQSASSHHPPPSNHPNVSNSQQHRDRDRDHQSAKNVKTPTSSQSAAGSNTPKSSSKDTKTDDKEVKVKQEGQKPTMETQGPPPPPTSQYYIHPSYMSPGPFGFEPAAHTMYRNMNMMAPYNASPYHLQMARFHAPEDLSRNTNPKALDILQHHANQYYNPHKIHELSERAIKSPTSNPKTTVSSPNIPQQPPSNNINSTAGHGPLSNAPPVSSSLPPVSGSTPHGPPKGSNTMSNNIAGNEKLALVGGGSGSGSNSELPSGKDAPPTGRSPPPQRHVHTHHHTHVGVGLGYPMYSAAYGGE